jgi:TDG/mug DNA glycosylase family protein
MSQIAPEQPLPDILAHGLNVVFCGINPGAAAASSGHHFLGRGNRFWPVLHLAGFTPQQMTPEQDRTVLQFGFGLTTAVARPTSRADELDASEFAESAAALLQKLDLYRPRFIAFLGKAAYAGISGKTDIQWGEQAGMLGPSRVWVLPNPSGLNRGFAKSRLAAAYGELRRSAFD